MPYKITNITHKTTKSPVPLNITFNDGITNLKEVINPGDHIFLYFIPKLVHQMHIRNMVTVEFVSNNDVLPPKINTKKEINSEIKKNTTKLEVSDKEEDKSKKYTSKKQK